MSANAHPQHSHTRGCGRLPCVRGVGDRASTSWHVMFAECSFSHLRRVRCCPGVPHRTPAGVAMSDVPQRLFVACCTWACCMLHAGLLHVARGPVACCTRACCAVSSRRCCLLRCRLLRAICRLSIPRCLPCVLWGTVSDTLCHAAFRRTTACRCCPRPQRRSTRLCSASAARAALQRTTWNARRATEGIE